MKILRMAGYLYLLMALEMFLISIRAAMKSPQFNVLEFGIAWLLQPILTCFIGYRLLFRPNAKPRLLDQLVSAAAVSLGDGSDELSIPPRHKTWQRWIVNLGLFMAVHNALWGVLIWYVVFHYEATPGPTVPFFNELSFCYPLVFGVIGFVSGISVGCLIAPSTFLRGPYGKRWLRLAGIDSPFLSRGIFLMLMTPMICSFWFSGYVLVILYQNLDGRNSPEARLQAERERRVADLTEKIRLDPQNANHWKFRGINWTELSEYGKALSDLNEADHLDPKNSTILEARGNAHLALEQFDLAIQDFDEVLKLAPKSIDTYQRRGHAWFRKGEYDRAIQDYDEVFKAYPQTYSLADRGNARLGKRDFDRAFADFNASIEKNSHDSTALTYRGEAWRLLGNDSEALKDFERAIHVEPEFAARAFERKAWLLATSPNSASRNGNLAIESALKACEMTHSKIYETQVTLAAAYAETGNFPKAIEVLQKAISSAPPAKKPDLLQHLESFKSDKPLRDKPVSKP